jgi:hypothetical protein
MIAWDQQFLRGQILLLSEAFKQRPRMLELLALDAIQTWSVGRWRLILFDSEGYRREKPKLHSMNMLSGFKEPAIV